MTGRSIEPGSDVRLYSFDVFDTAVCRLIHAPEHIHLLVARKLRNRGLIQLSDFEWMYARQEAEFRQRMLVPHSEVTFDQIFLRLAADLKLPSETAQAAHDLEFEEELRLIRPIAATQQLIIGLMRENKQIIFLSDTYFSGKQVEALLKRAGYSRPLHVISSSDELRSKIAGTIYDHVTRQNGIASSSIEHLGDNRFSDVRNAQAHGWNAKYFTGSHWTTRERVLFASGKGDSLSSAIAGSARAARLGQVAPVREGVASVAASVVGPLFVGYVLWILMDVLERGGRTIYFLARDCQVMVPICQRLARWLGADIDARYTYASRQAFLLAALPDDEEEIVDEALKLAFYDNITLFEALTSLGYTEREMASISRTSQIALQSTSPSLSAARRLALRQSLADPELLAPLRARAADAQRATLAYLDKEQMFSQDVAYIVDLGWRGNTQLRLEKAVRKRVDVFGYYMGLTNVVLGPESKWLSWLPLSVRVKTGLLEIMSAADHTSVKGFALSEAAEPVCWPALTEDTAAIEWGAREQQDIAIRFAEYLTECIEPSQFEPAELYEALRSAGLDAYDHFRLSPTWAEAEAYGGFQHQDDVNHLHHRQLAQAVTSTQVVKHLFDRKARSSVGGWYSGSLARSKECLAPMLINKMTARTLELLTRMKTRRRKKLARQTARVALRELLK